MFCKMPDTHNTTDWCPHCGCGNDSRGLAHLSTCPTGQRRRREAWIGEIQEFIEERIKDAPDASCRVLADNLWDQTAEFDEDA